MGSPPLKVSDFHGEKGEIGALVYDLGHRFNISGIQLPFRHGWSPYI
jgi:hypothetical protein